MYFRFRFIVVTDSGRSVLCPVPTVRRQLITAAAAADTADGATDDHCRLRLSPDRRSRNGDADGAETAASNNTGSATVVITAKMRKLALSSGESMHTPFACILQQHSIKLDVFIVDVNSILTMCTDRLAA